MDWTRRSVLQAVGAVALTPLLEACGGPPKTPVTAPVALRGMPEVRDQIRALVESLSRDYAHASALATVREVGGAAADAGERGSNRVTEAGVVFRVSDGASFFERATSDLSGDGIALAAAAVRDGLAPGGGRQRDIGAAEDFAATSEIDPASLAPQQWLERVDALYRRAQRVGGSRIIYRGAYLTVDDTQTLFIGDGRDVLQRVVRTRGGVLLVAWTGSTPTVEDANHGGTMGLEALELSTETLERAADNALSLLTPTPAPTGETAVILDPSVAALIAHQCVGRAFEADRWMSGESLVPRLDGPLGSPQVTIVDDPSVGGGYGSYYFDDEGYPAEPTYLVRNGEVGSPVTDRATAAALDVPRTANARRASPLDPMSPRVSNVSFEPGTASRDELIESMGDGLLLEGGLVARMDLRTGRFAVRATRARDIEGGKLSGRLYGTVDLHGDLTQLLSAVTGVTTDTERFASTCVHGERDAVPISISGPLVLTRGEVSG